MKYFALYHFYTLIRVSDFISNRKTTPGALETDIYCNISDICKDLTINCSQLFQKSSSVMTSGAFTICLANVAPIKST